MHKSRKNEGIIINGGTFQANTLAVGNQASVHIVPSSHQEKTEYEYDVALSFASEDRGYVQLVAMQLVGKGVHVFYDEFESTRMWGKDLLRYLHEVFRYKAKYCVPFLSVAYRQKFWTNHERESACERAAISMNEYILPVKLDDTEIPGISSTVMCADGRVLSPLQIADKIREKLWQGRT